MIRGTTTKHIFNIPLEASDIKEVKITYSQNGKIVLSKKKNECTIGDNTIVVALSQEDTFKFDSSTHVNIQVRILTDKGSVFSSKIMSVGVGACLDDEVLK